MFSSYTEPVINNRWMNTVSQQVWFFHVINRSHKTRKKNQGHKNHIKIKVCRFYLPVMMMKDEDQCNLSCVWSSGLLLCLFFLYLLLCDCRGLPLLCLLSDLYFHLCCVSGSFRPVCVLVLVSVVVTECYWSLKGLCFCPCAKFTQCFIRLVLRQLCLVTLLFPVLWLPHVFINTLPSLQSLF